MVYAAFPTVPAVIDPKPHACVRDEYPYYNHPTDMDIPIFEKGPGAMLGIVDGITIPLPADRT